MTNVNSGIVDHIEWHDGKLTIWFNGDERCEHNNVPEPLFAALLGSSSKDQFYADHIKDRY